VPKTATTEIRARLAALGAEFKAPGRFPIPRACVGGPHCNLGLIDTKAVSARILARFADRGHTKAKLKLALSGCILSCSGTRTSDIGIVATRNGYDVYAGGKGGPAPKIGRRIKKEVTEAEMLAAIETLIDFHDRKTGTKQRMAKLLGDPDFPLPSLTAAPAAAGPGPAISRRPPGTDRAYNFTGDSGFSIPKRGAIAIVAA